MSLLNRSKKPTPLECSKATYWPTSLWLTKMDSPLSTPPLSPAESRSPRKYDDDDDDEPLSLLSATLKSKMSLLHDDHEEGDDELIPIACLNKSPFVLSAAEKYKQKVKLQLDLFEI